jgi:hypothetical protein
LRPDDTRLFIVGEAEPASALNRSGEVLLVWSDLSEPAGPPLPAQPPTEPASEAVSAATAAERAQ